ncbi:MAG: amidohydrolase [Chloroflexi bacterium]|nr:amidohydrolase [Chloroflexota bacterium]
MKVDMILSNGIVVTMDKRLEVFPRGAVVIKDGQIVAVGPATDLSGRYEAEQAIDCVGQVVMPGLINAHTHVPMSLLRGLADDLRLDVWLYGYMLPVEREFVNEESCYYATLLSCAEMIRSGVTCFADMYYFEEEVARAAQEVGLRAVCAETVMKLPTPDAASYDESLEYCQRFIAGWKGHELIVPAVGPHSPYTCTPEILREMARLAQEYDVPLLIHLSETEGDVEGTRQLYGCAPAFCLDDFGVLDSKTLAVHGVHLTEEEMELLVQKSVGVAHCPTSNLKLASGVAPVARMLDLGLKVGIGTDGPASNNDQDMFEEMRLAALLAKGTTRDPKAVPARIALTMATIGGARALHLDHITGSIEVGKQADLTVVDVDVLHITPKFDLSVDNIYSRLVYATKSADVRHVLVNGRLLMKDRELLTVNVDTITAEVQRIADRVNVFLMRREESLLDKLVAIGGLEWKETFEVQVKGSVEDEAVVMEGLIHPDISAVWSPSVRDQYDAYLLFADASQGCIRHREDNVVREEGGVPESIRTLTLTGSGSEQEFDNSVLLSRSRFTSKADRTLRFYCEYFEPDSVKEVHKHRQRWHIRYKGVQFAVNLDRLTKPAHEGAFLEIKSRTWSKKDAEQKALLIGELLDVFSVDRESLLKRDYVDF